MTEPESTAAKRRAVWPWSLVALVLAASLIAAALVYWKGPSSVLRWAVRAYDPALRLKVGASHFRGGEWVLRGVRLDLRGSREPVLEAREIRLGFGADLLRGSLRSVAIVEPFLRIDRNALDHFSEQSGGGYAAWEIGAVSVERGHVWIAGFGEPGLDISAGVDGNLTGVAPSRGQESHHLLISNFYLACQDGETRLPVLGAGKSGMTFTLDGLRDGRISGLRVEEGWMIAGVGLQRLVAGGSPENGSAPGSSTIIESLDLVRLQVQPDGLPSGLPNVRLQVSTALRDIPVGAAAGELGRTVHHMEFSDVELLSPTDPLRRAMTIRSVFVRFSLEGLAKKDLEELIMLSPTVYVGEPLFEYMQSADDPATVPSAVRESEGWNVREMKVNFGRVVIAVGGRSQFGLPLAFYTTARNLSLSSLAGLNVELVLKVPTEDYDFPAYDLSLARVRGDLRFNYPPDVLRNNIVNVVKFDRARWRNFHARDLWVAVTFDRKGINGNFGGRAYSGYVNGGFSFFLQPDSPWTGWINGDGLDLSSLTADGAPQHFVMDGTADFTVEANGSAAVVERVRGKVEGRGKGRVVINKLNDLLAAIPADWSSLKSESSRVTLETLRDFDYTESRSDFWFTGRQGIVNVRMKGPAGSRNLEIVFHGRGDSARAAWQQGGRR